MKPLLTVVTISYNQSHFIKDCVDSTSNIYENEIQHLIIDAGSTDDSRAILTRLQKERKNIELIFESDAGPADGLNKGILAAKGEWVCFLNSDDFFLVNGLKDLIKLIRKSENFDFIYGNGLKFSQGRIETKIVSTFSKAWFEADQLKMFQQSTAFRTSFLIEKGVKFNLENRTCWDLEFCLDVIQAGSRNLKSNLFFGGFRIHGNSISGSGRLELEYVSDVLRLKKAIRNSKSKFRELIIELNSIFNQLFFRIILHRRIRRLKSENSHFSR